MRTALTSTAILMALSSMLCACGPSSTAQPHADAGPTGTVPSTTGTGTGTGASGGSPSSSSAPTSPASVASGASSAAPMPPKRTDTITTSKGELHVTPINHASVMLEHDGKVIYVDPTKEGSVEGLPKADVIFITDIHGDHMDQAGIDRVKKPGTVLVGPPAVGETIKLDVTIKNGEKRDVQGIGTEAIPMYNLVRGPSAGKLFHDKGRGNGYVLTFANRRVYLSGDTECTDEMKALKDIDVAFVCMNLPYTMPPTEAAVCVNAFHPKVLFPYHFRGSSPEELRPLINGPTTDVRQATDVRIRAWY